MLHNEKTTLLIICSELEKSLSEVDPIPETMEQYMETIKHAKKLKQLLREYETMEEEELIKLREQLKKFRSNY